MYVWQNPKWTVLSQHLRVIHKEASGRHLPYPALILLVLFSTFLDQRQKQERPSFHALYVCVTYTCCFFQSKRQREREKRSSFWSLWVLAVAGVKLGLFLQTSRSLKMSATSSDRVALIFALAGRPLMKRVDEDELSVSVAPSPTQSSLGVSLTIKPIFVLTCQWPAPLHLVASKGMVNQAFHVPRPSAPRPPSASPKAPSSVVPVETRVAPPAAVSSPCPGFQNALLHCGLLDHTTRNQTNWWVRSENTQNTLCSQATSLCCRSQDLWSSWNEVWKLMWVRSWGNGEKMISVVLKTLICKEWLFSGRKEGIFSYWCGILKLHSGLLGANSRANGSCICGKKSYVIVQANT